MKDLFQELVLNPIMHSIEAYASNNAFFIGGLYHTYREFGQAVADARLRVGGKEEKVCILDVKDNLETYATIVALWLEGKAFVPLNRLQPEHRNKAIVKQIAHPDCHYEDALAYVLFTSGSTGTPKGVAISRKNVGAFMDSFWKTGIHIHKDDRCLQCFDLTFDVAIQSFLVALTQGACIYTVPYGTVKYLSAASLIHEHHITFGAMAPSMLTYLQPYFSELDASSFKTCILTAEACPAGIVEAWQRCAQNVEVYDFYGPTETTVYATYYKCNRNQAILSDNGIVSIGKPLPNVQALVMNENGNPVMTPHERGELLLYGDQVTQGYWNNAEKNRDAFSLLTIEGENLRYYHTGDLCYWSDTGDLMYVGRIDQQAKIQGFRVELPEIEFHVRAYYNNAIQTAAVAFQNTQGLTEIAMFIEHPEENPEQLSEYLRSVIPSYMIPSKWIYMEKLPLNVNDKIDRTQLKTLI